FGPSAGQKVTFTRPAAWLGHSVAADADEALRSFTRRFLAANGPATREDYARWWGITPPRAGARREALGDEGGEVSVDGEGRFMLAGASAEAASCSPSGLVRLVPMFDQYVVGATLHAGALLPSEDLRARVYRPQGWITAVVLVDGRMDGVWRWERKGRRLVVA